MQIKTLIGMFLLVIAFGFSGVSTNAQETPDAGTEGMAKANPKTETVETEGLGAGKTHHKFPKGQCTQCAADSYYARTGTPVTWRGNAKDWLMNAKNAGAKTTTDQNKIVSNAILVFGPVGKNPYGHVVIVDAVFGDTIRITECNYAVKLGWSTRKIKFKDLSRLNFWGAILP